MIDWKIVNSSTSIKFCKGTIVAAKVYADVEGNRCKCGGSFSSRINHPDEPTLNLPVCNQCGVRPELYVIDAFGKDDQGNKIKFRIRYTKDNERLNSPFKVAYILNVIQRELNEGSFNISHYVSAVSKEKFIFKNYVKTYTQKYTGDEIYNQWKKELEELEEQSLPIPKQMIKPKGRAPIKKITPKALAIKIRLIEKEILPFFGNIEIFRIKDATIKRFKESITGKDRTRDLALGELKAILNEAHRDDMITTQVKFERIPRARKRNDFITRELALKTIDAMPKQLYKDFFTLLLTYPLRPGELRALRWSEVDLSKGAFTVKAHFSGKEIIDGRKSVGLDKKEGTVTYPITQAVREIFQRQRSAHVVSLNEFVFLSRYGTHFTEDGVADVWRRARDRVGHKHPLYELRHAAATELLVRTGGNILRVKEVGGWTNIGTVERYVKDRSDNSDLFE